jgi:hypothetical protein
LEANRRSSSRTDKFFIVIARISSFLSQKTKSISETDYQFFLTVEGPTSSDFEIESTFFSGLTDPLIEFFFIVLFF